MSGLVVKEWKSSSFIDTNMLASMPREVPMPYKIQIYFNANVCNPVQTWGVVGNNVVVWVTFLSG